MISLLAEQANELIKYLQEEKKELPLFICDNIYRYITFNNKYVNESQLTNKLFRIKENLYHINIKKCNKSILITLQPNDVECISKEDIIDNDISGSFNIVNLLLLKCYIFLNLFEELSVDLKTIEIIEIIEELESLDSISLSSCQIMDLDSDLGHIMTKISSIEQKYVQSTRRKLQKDLLKACSPYNNYTDELDYIARRDFLSREISEDMVYKSFEDYFIRYSRTLYANMIKITTDVEELNTVSKSVLIFFFSSVSRCCVEFTEHLSAKKMKPKRMPKHDWAFDNLIYRYILEDYMRLLTFYRFISIIKINQISGFSIEFKV